MVEKVLLLTAVSKPYILQWLNSMSFSCEVSCTQLGFAFVPSKVRFLKTSPAELPRVTTGPAFGRNTTLSALSAMEVMVILYLPDVLRLLRLMASV